MGDSHRVNPDRHVTPRKGGVLFEGRFMLKTNICKKLNISYPVILGGMAFAGNYHLAAAVSMAGGLGVIASGHLSPGELEEEIRRYYDLVDVPPGVNCFIRDEDVNEKAERACRAGISALFTGIGNPLQLKDCAEKHGVPLVPTIASIRHVEPVLAAGADMIVAEGQEGGGHIGKTGTLPLLPQVVREVGGRVPVIAAGGIGDGSQLVACLAMGASGVMMGTRFLVARECPVHENFKEMIIGAGSDDTTITGHFTGFPMRCLKNDFTAEYRLKEKTSPSYEMLQFGRGKICAGLIEGDIAQGSLPAGQVAGQLKEVEPAGEIIKRIIDEAEEIVRSIVDRKGLA